MNASFNLLPAPQIIITILKGVPSPVQVKEICKTLGNRKTKLK